MTTTSFETAASDTTPARTAPLTRASVWPWLGLGAIVALAAALRLANLDSLGYANHYYTAGITSMLLSGRNFFFVAAEPGGAVSIDKPPVGLWLQAISAYFLGINGFAMLLPEIVCGLASVVVLFHLVRRRFGVSAGLLAALALAITPIVVATDRNNTIDSILILTLLLAAWAFIKATESGRLRFLLLGAALVGIGFNIKMLQAYLPLPAFYALYVLGASVSVRRKVVSLVLATILLLAVSLSWAVVVEMTPADQRPYVGSSGTNSVLNLMLGYNGLQRLTGMGGGVRDGGQTARPDGNGQFQPPDGNGQPPNIGDGGGVPGGGARGGFPGTGQPGLLRLFSVPLSKEVSWLLPFGLFSAALLMAGARFRWPLATEHQAVVLWGGWLVAGGIFFSVAGFFHEYYLSMLAPPLAALVGVGVIGLWRLRERNAWLATSLLLLAGGVTLAFQAFTATSFVTNVWWLPMAIALFVIGAVLLVASAGWRVKYSAVAGFVCVIAALLLTPGLWSGLTMLNSSGNQSLPAAYSGQSSGPSNNGDLQINQSLLDYLTANTQSTEYLLAVPSSMQGADYVIATRRPVLYLGGFSGQDNVVSVDDLAAMVADNELRYIYWNTDGGNGFGGGRGGNQSTISAWVTSACTAVPGFDTATISAGAPDGAPGGLGNGGLPGGGRQMQMTLYECGG